MEIPTYEETKKYLAMYDKDTSKYRDYKRYYIKYLIRERLEERKKNFGKVEDYSKVRYLPVANWSEVPSKYKKIYDSEEYLKKVYEKLGIQIIDYRDEYTYGAILPEELKLKRVGTHDVIVDLEGKELIDYILEYEATGAWAYVHKINPEITIEEEKQYTR